MEKLDKLTQQEKARSEKDSRKTQHKTKMENKKKMYKSKWTSFLSDEFIMPGCKGLLNAEFILQYTTVQKIYKKKMLIQHYNGFTCKLIWNPIYVSHKCDLNKLAGLTSVCPQCWAPRRGSTNRTPTTTRTRSTSASVASTSGEVPSYEQQATTCPSATILP